MFQQLYCQRPFKKLRSRCDHIRICWYCGCDTDMREGGTVDRHDRIKCEDPNCY